MPKVVAALLRVVVPDLRVRRQRVKEESSNVSFLVLVARFCGINDPRDALVCPERGFKRYFCRWYCIQVIPGILDTQRLF